MKNVLLPVRYRGQMDNDVSHHGPGYRQCFLTSMAMTLDYLYGGVLSDRAAANGMAEPESWYGQRLKPYGDTTNGQAHEKCINSGMGIGLNKYRVEDCHDGSFSRLDAQIQAGYPVPVGVHYKGSGHRVVVVGHDPDRDMYRVHDPYGVRAGSSDRYIRIGNYGANDYYSKDLMRKLWSGPNDNDGWAMFFSENK